MIMRYNYRTGIPEMFKRYGIKPHWHGWYQCDRDDFQHFYDQIKYGGEVTKVYVEIGGKAYAWEQNKGWKQLKEISYED